MEGGGGRQVITDHRVRVSCAESRCLVPPQAVSAGCRMLFLTVGGADTQVTLQRLTAQVMLVMSWRMSGFESFAVIKNMTMFAVKMEICE